MKKNSLCSMSIAQTNAFFTGTAAEVILVQSVDRRVIGNGEPGPMTKKLSLAFYEKIGKIMKRPFMRINNAK